MTIAYEQSYLQAIAKPKLESYDPLSDASLFHRA